TEIFILKRTTAAAPSKDEFICIADPVDLAEYPVNAPNLDDNMPYYRVSEIVLLFRSYIELSETKDLIDKDIRKLVSNLNAIGLSVEEKTYV
ncbi:MAG: hypothetical protein NC902_08530, partial [Candidatus Omnitrophica bacterium]|nr:hypothetical protein [Candidatus Omnitrophota bacterium]